MILSCSCESPNTYPQQEEMGLVLSPVEKKGYFTKLPTAMPDSPTITHSTDGIMPPTVRVLVYPQKSACFHLATIILIQYAASVWPVYIRRPQKFK